jgi:hypothetical protein
LAELILSLADMGEEETAATAVPKAEREAEDLRGGARSRRALWY